MPKHSTLDPRKVFPATWNDPIHHLGAGEFERKVSIVNEPDPRLPGELLHLAVTGGV